MPTIEVAGPSIADMDVRRALVRELTEAAAKAYAMPREKIIVMLREVKPDQVAVGGELISDRK